ncbi:hypothetical protein [Sporosarcina jiandibaonis]|uniref:hypothetical protein n=1 Tax=Sporosarcina jiandibaonis TaxID=2715535 RepID=UPI0015580921|nr:hypothetical protein [Sporosarcina jiandibaonis]
MQRKDHLSDDVIKIFHNAMGSVKNNVEKWTDHNAAYMAGSEETVDRDWNSNSNSQRNHAAGEYEPLQERNTHSFSIQEKDESINMFSEPAPENDIDDQIDEENRILLENEERMEDIEDMRSEYRGNIGDKR